MTGIKITADEIAQLRKSAATYEARADNLLSIHGHGVRPSWVSAEIAAHGSRADNLSHAADEMQAEINRAVASAEVLGPIAAAACHNVCLTLLHETINTTKGN
jgi:hypothetical protein